MRQKIVLFLVLAFSSLYINAQQQPQQREKDDLAILDRVPVAKGCNPEMTNKALRNCYFRSVQETIMKRIYPGYLRKQGLEPGMYTAVAKFRVNTKGKVDEIEVDFENEKIAKHIKKAVKKIKKSEPALKDGKPVNVIYALPVKFRI